MVIEAGGVGGVKFSLNWKSAGVNLYWDGLNLDSVGGVVELTAAGAERVEVLGGV